MTSSVLLLLAAAGYGDGGLRLSHRDLLILFGDVSLQVVLSASDPVPWLTGMQHTLQPSPMEKFYFL